MTVATPASLAVLLLATAVASGGAPVPEFTDVTAVTGLSGYVAATGDGHGPGTVFTDLDGDGWPDLYLMRAWTDGANRMYRNVAGPGGTRAFVRVPGDAGAGDPGNATGAVAGDYDNDGDLDLFVLNFDQPNVLLRNDLVETGAFGFTDVTAATDPTPGVADEQYGVGNATFEGIVLDNTLTAAWGDPDRDGDLDLYVGNHNGWWNNNQEGPFTVPGRRDVFYRNNGDGTFHDVTMQHDVTGFRGADGTVQNEDQRFSSTNAVQFADFDNDGWPDLLVSNKIGGPSDRDMLYRNRGADGGGTWLGFELVTWTLVPSFGDASGAAMGVAIGDPDNDGDLDIYFTDWSDIPAGGSGQNDLWINQLTETGTLAFVHSSDLPAVYSWGTVLQDFDLDGDEDLHVAVQGPERDYVYLSDGAGGWTEAATAAGVAQTGNGRGDVSADFDRDGWPDLFVVNLDGGSSILWRNDTAAVLPAHRFLSARLVGDPLAPGSTRSTRDAVGARMTVVADLDGNGTIDAGERQMREVNAGTGNAGSTGSFELEFGLGPATTGRAEIRWPGGARNTFVVGTGVFRTFDEALLRPGDLDADGTVGFADLNELLTGWGPCPAAPDLCVADIDDDGATGFADLSAMLENWGTAAAP